MGGIKSIPGNEMATMIWEWCLKHNIWLSATIIPGSKNIQADKESRVLKESSEWSLSQEVFNAIQERWGKCDIDLFASRLLRSLNMSHGDLTLGHSLLMLSL